MKKYEINEDFFSEINTEEKAYALGLLYADGYINKKETQITLTLSSKDVDILKKLNKLIYPNKHPLRCRKQSSNSYFVLNITNKKMAKDVVNLGCGNKKSWILTFPSNKQVPSTFIPHFIRGYFDGDGSISQYKLQKTFNIIGTKSFIQSVYDEFEKMNIQCHFVTHKCGMWYIRITDIRNLNKIYHYLYDNSKIFLKRKKQKFDYIIKHSHLKELKSERNICKCGNQWRFSIMENRKLFQSKRFDTEEEAVKFKKNYKKSGNKLDLVSA